MKGSAFSSSRKIWISCMKALMYLCSGLTGALVLFLMGYVLIKGIPNISWELLSTSPSYLSDRIGILPDLMNTLYIVLATIVIVLPLGVGAAIYLTEYAKNKKLVAVMEYAAETLSGIPSIIYGLVGMLVFCEVLGMGTSLLAGALTLAMSAAITALSFVLLEGLYLNRYWIPLMTLGAPVMAACLTGETNAPLRRGCALLFAGVVLTASAMQITSTMKHPEITDVQRERAAFLQESGLTFGYATFWNANVITELTNGEVEAVGITIAQNEKGQGVPRVSEWLEAQENRRMERPDERVFMLLTEAESERLDDFLKKSGAQARCTRDGMTAYEIESQRIFFETAQAMDTP